MRFDNCKYDHLQLAAQFLSMAEKFLPYAANAENKVSMLSANIDVHPCGTVACHGGYAALALGVKTKDYLGGAMALAVYLGFTDHFKFKLWAHNHPDLWGNNKGECMFNARQAFISVWKDDFGLNDIVSHYLSVAKRLMEIKE